MFNVHRGGLAPAAIVTLALWAGACGGATGSSSTSDKPTAKQTAAAKRRIDINATPRDQVKDGGTMRWPIEQFSSQWNYNQLEGPESATYDVVLGLMPWSFVSDERTNVTPNPNYVVSATVESTPKQVVTIKLNPKAKWSDGRPITWEDYRTQWQALRGTDSAYSVASSTGYERIGSVERGADDFEVVIAFDRPFGEWKSLFTPLYPKQLQDTPKRFNTGYTGDIPVTAGPFKLGKIDKTAQTVRIVRDSDWWGEPAKLDSIVFNTLEIDAMTNAFANGEVDRVNIGPDPSAFKRASRAAGSVVRIAGGPDFRHFTINGTSPLLGDADVRRALALSINRDAIAKSDLTGLNWPPVTMDSHFFVNTQDGYADTSGEYGKFDPARAKTLLDQAGWKTGGAFRRKGGKTLELRFVIPSGVPASRQEGELAQAMLKDVGIKLDVRSVPSDVWFDEYVTKGNFDITPGSWFGTSFPISQKSIYLKPTKDKKGVLQIQQNYARIGSPEIDRLMTEAEEKVDLGEARDLINQADKLIWDEAHSLILYQRPQNIGVNAKLANVGAFGFKTPVYADIGFEK